MYLSRARRRKCFRDRTGRQSESRNTFASNCKKMPAWDAGGVVHRRGRLCKKPPPMAASFRSFLADTRKEHSLPTTINDNLPHKNEPFWLVFCMGDFVTVFFVELAVQ